MKRKDRRLGITRQSVPSTCCRPPRSINPTLVGTAVISTYGYAKDGSPILKKDPKLLLNDNNVGKAEGIHLMIGRRPYAALGNSTGTGKCWSVHHGSA